MTRQGRVLTAPCRINGVRMKHNEAIEYYHSLEKFGINPGLERINALCDALGNPQDKPRFVHIAGTNGKGSTAAMLSRILMASGCKTGLYTSPYVIDFRERMQIDGVMITEDKLASVTDKVKTAVTRLESVDIQPTEFEAITAAAFYYFAARDCDIVVLETGLGGRFDATNLIKTPLVSVITSISKDHMAVLGDTIEKIAKEKCGIVKRGGVTVTFPEQDPVALGVIEKAALKMKNRLLVPSIEKIQLIHEDIYGSTASIDGLEIRVPFMGRHMALNAAMAVEAAKALKIYRNIEINDNHIVNGIETASMPARMEIIRTKPLTILDGGHNEGCAAVLAQAIETHLRGRRIIAVCAMMADKDYESYLRQVAGKFDTFIATQPAVPRALKAHRLADAAANFCHNVRVIEDPYEAYRRANDITGKEDVIIICGSFYLASELRTKREFIKNDHNSLS